MKISNLAAIALCTVSFLTPASSPYAYANEDERAAIENTTAQDEALKQSFERGEFSKIVETLQPLKNKTPKQYNMLISALMNTDLDEAEEAAEDFIHVHGNNFKAYHMHASVMGAQASSSIFSALGYAKKAKKSLEKAVEIAPDNIAVYQALMQFHLMAPSIAGGDMDEAVKLTQKIAELDATEGQFALARVYLEDGKETEAKAVFEKLIEDEATQIRGRVELGSFYLGDKQYASSYDILTPLADVEIAEVEKKESEAWEAYQEAKSNLLYGKYRLGQVAVESGKYTTVGINALEGYLEDYATTNIDRKSLPSTKWAQLRLAELYLNANRIDEAQRMVNLLDGEHDERFSKILKKINKAIKKRAAVQHRKARFLASFNLSVYALQRFNGIN